MKKIHDTNYYRGERYEDITEIQNAISNSTCGLDGQDKLDYLYYLLEVAFEDMEFALKDGTDISYSLDISYEIPTKDSKIADKIHAMVHSHNIRCAELRKKYFP